jgi:NADH:ubiquinone oxidoreductase subunit 6 (subunit J)
MHIAYPIPMSFLWIIVSYESIHHPFQIIMGHMHNACVLCRFRIIPFLDILRVTVRVCYILLLMLPIISMTNRLIRSIKKKNCQNLLLSSLVQHLLP